NDTPIINLDPKDDGAGGVSIKGDSLVSMENVEKVFYVLKGITPFGEISPPSEKAGITDEEPLSANPILEKPTVIENEKVELVWTFSEAKEQVITGFNIERRSKTN